MTRKNLREILGLSRSKFDIFFNYLRNKNIIVVDFYKNIRINQNYFCKGEIDNIKSNDFTRIYIKPMQHLFDNVDVRKHRRLGNFCRLVPYIHRNTNILCWNSDCMNIRNIEKVYRKDLEKILNIHRNTVHNFINDMNSIRLENNKPIITFTDNSDNFYKLPIIVNPKIFYGGNFDYLENKNDMLKWFLPVRNKL